jgi:hypothetical protein
MTNATTADRRRSVGDLLSHAREVAGRSPAGGQVRALLASRAQHRHNIGLGFALIGFACLSSDSRRGGRDASAGVAELRRFLRSNVQ